MNEDRELLELAAFAAGHKINKLMQGERDAIGAGDVGLWIDGVSTCWNPLGDDGHALRLALKLNIVVGSCKCWTYGDPLRGCMFGEDPLQGIEKATRRAIVRAAASIVKQMKEQGE